MRFLISSRPHLLFCLTFRLVAATGYSHAIAFYMDDASRWRAPIARSVMSVQPAPFAAMAMVQLDSFCLQLQEDAGCIRKPLVAGMCVTCGSGYIASGDD